MRREGEGEGEEGEGGRERGRAVGKQKTAPSLLCNSSKAKH